MALPVCCLVQYTDRQAECYSGLPVRSTSSENAMVWDQHASSNGEAKDSLGNVNRQSPRHQKASRDNWFRLAFFRS